MLPLAHRLPLRRISSSPSSNSQLGVASLQSAIDCNNNNNNNNKAVCATLIRQCIALKALPQGERLQEQILKWGLEGDTLLGNLLIQMNGSFGRVEQAQIAFRRIRSRNVFSWTILIGALAQNGHLQAATAFFNRMPQRNTVSWNGLISAHALCGDPNQALSLYWRMNHEGEKPNEKTLLAVLDACGSGGLKFLAYLNAARRTIFEEIETGFFQDGMLRSSLVRTFGKCGSVEDAKQVFDNLLDLDIICWNSILAAYAQNGHLPEAKQIFARMPQRSTVSWNSMITAYAHNRHGREAVDLFFEMQAAGVLPNQASYVIALDACAAHGLLEQGREIHASVIADDQELQLGALLVNMYGKCGSPDEAEAFFFYRLLQISQPSLVSCNAMISAFAQQQDDRKKRSALKLLRMIDLEGCCQADEITVVAAIEGCCNDLAQVRSIQSSITHREELSCSVFVKTAFLNAFARCGSLDLALELFEGMLEKTVVSWNSIISVCIQRSRSDLAMEFFLRMDLEGVQPNFVTVAVILDACSSDLGRKIHAAIAGSSLESDQSVCSALISMYGKFRDLESAKTVYRNSAQLDPIDPSSCSSSAAMITALSHCGRIHEARLLFQKMPQKTLVAWNAMLGAFAENDQDEQAVKLFLEMTMIEGVIPDAVTFTTIFGSCCADLPLELVRMIHSAVNELGIEKDDLVASAIVKMYGKRGDLASARAVFDSMPALDPASWNVMIAACAYNHTGSDEESDHLCGARTAMIFFRKMLLEGARPNLISFTLIIDACAELAESVNHARVLHGLITSAGLGSSQILCNAMIHLYGRCGNPCEALRVFDRMPERSSVSWTSIITALGGNGDSAQALQIFRKMNLEGLNPDEITYFVILLALSHAGDLDRCAECFKNMQADHELQPDADHYGCIIDLLGRSGQLSSAEELLASMPFEPGRSAWTMLLGASRIQFSLRHGKRAAEIAAAADAEHPAPYVLLRNLYA